MVSAFIGTAFAQEDATAVQPRPSDKGSDQAKLVTPRWGTRPSRACTVSGMERPPVAKIT
jgi:hypothetical protein